MRGEDTEATVFGALNALFHACREVRQHVEALAVSRDQTVPGGPVRAVAFESL